MTETTEPNRYPLGVQKDTLRRYRLFNEVYQPGTIGRFAALPVSPDMNILEVGCGIGVTTCYMAKTLVPDGHVTAFDAAAELVDLARQHAAEQGINNVTFVCAKAQDFEYPRNHYDLAHTRFVLSYLADAGDIVKKVHDALRPSGIFFSEEIAESYIGHGRTPWYDNMIKWFGDMLRATGGNPDYGHSRLASDMVTAGFSSLSATAYWPIEDQATILDMIRTALSREMKQNLIEFGIATGEEVDAVVAAMAAPEKDAMISAAMSAQIVGRKSR